MKTFVNVLLTLNFFIVFHLRAEVWNKPLILKVGYLEDKRVPTVSEKDIKGFLEEARDELKTKFGATYIRFDYRGKEDIRRFFKKYLKKNSALYKKYENRRYKFFSEKIDYKPYKDEIKKFLKQWKIWDLKKFFPEEIQKKILTYDDVIEPLFKIYLEKLKILENLKTKEGRYLINRRNNYYNSYINWVVAMWYQDKYDIVISNCLIVYDDITKPYPHAVLRYAKVGGSSFESPERKIFGGTSAMVNLFEMLTDIPYFEKPYQKGKITQKEWNGIVGRFILAHEIGHALYLIPDVYNHPKGCLMDSSVQTMDYYQGYLLLKKYPIQCPMCQPYVTAREHHLLADYLMKEGKYNDAIYEYKLAKKMTPVKLDIDYNKYISKINYKIAFCYYKLNNEKKSLQYIKKSLSLDPSNKEAQKLKKLLNK